MKRGLFVVLLSVFTIAAFAQTKTAAKPAAKKPATSSASMKLSFDRGKVIYTTYCLACHQADGSGVPRLNPPLIKTKWVVGDKKELINIILKGMDEIIEIDGEEYSNVMASHAFLKDQEIADVLTYIRNSFGNKASIVTPAEVKTVRAQAK